MFYPYFYFQALVFYLLFLFLGTSVLPLFLFPGTRPALPNIKMDDDYLPVLEIFYACTETDHARRPSAKQVLHTLYCLEEDEKKKIESLVNVHLKDSNA